MKMREAGLTGGCERFLVEMRDHQDFAGRGIHHHPGHQPLPIEFGHEAAAGFAVLVIHANNSYPFSGLRRPYCCLHTTLLYESFR